MSRIKKPQPTFEVALLGDLHPEQIPLRAVSDVLAAVQDLASARDSFMLASVPDELAIGLLDVRRGSACFHCVARDPHLAINNLRTVGRILQATDIPDVADCDRLATMLRPIEELSRIAKSLACEVVVRVVGTAKTAANQLISVAEKTYDVIAERAFVHGDTTIIGRIERVGGATEMRCLMRVPGRHRLLYCNVHGRDLARQLGQHLYEDIAATGRATWIHHNWRVHSFTIHDFSQPKLGPVDAMIESLRKAGLDEWDRIDNPRKFLQRCGA